MGIEGIIALIIAGVGLMFGAFFGHGLGKSSGRREGAQQAQQQQEIIQARETVQAVQERAHVEAEVGADSYDELDTRLRKHDRSS